MKTKELKAYCANTSGNTIIEKILDRAYTDVYTGLKRFLDGESRNSTKTENIISVLLKRNGKWAVESQY